MKKVKITVLRKEFYPDFADKYLTDGKTVGPCPLLEEGDEFIFEGSAKMPEGHGLTSTAALARCPPALHASRGITAMDKPSYAVRMGFVPLYSTSRQSAIMMIPLNRRIKQGIFGCYNRPVLKRSISSKAMLTVWSRGSSSPRENHLASDSSLRCKVMGPSCAASAWKANICDPLIPQGWLPM